MTRFSMWLISTKHIGGPCVNSISNVIHTLREALMYTLEHPQESPMKFPATLTMLWLMRE